MKKTVSFLSVVLLGAPLFGLGRIPAPTDLGTSQEKFESTYERVGSYDVAFEDKAVRRKYKSDDYHMEAVFVYGKTQAVTYEAKNRLAGFSDLDLNRLFDRVGGADNFTIMREAEYRDYYLRNDKKVQVKIEKNIDHLPYKFITNTDYYYDVVDFPRRHIPFPGIRAKKKDGKLVSPVTGSTAPVVLADVGELEKHLLDLKAQEYTPRVDALKALEKMGTAAQAASDDVAELVNDDVGLVATQAIKTLGVISEGTNKGVTPLRSVLNGTNKEHAYEAIRALGKIGEEASVVVPDLVAIMRNPTEPEKNRHAAFAALESIGTSGALAATRNSDIKQKIDEKIALLSSGTPDERKTALSELAQLGDMAQSAVPTLIPMLKDNDPLIRNQVAYALGRVSAGKENVVDALVNELSTQDNAFKSYIIRALGSMGSEAEKAVQPLANILRNVSNDDSVRSETYRTLKSIGTEEAEQTLEGYTGPK